MSHFFLKSLQKFAIDFFLLNPVKPVSLARRAGCLEPGPSLQTPAVPQRPLLPHIQSPLDSAGSCIPAPVCLRAPPAPDPQPSLCLEHFPPLATNNLSEPYALHLSVSGRELCPLLLMWLNAPELLSS